MRNLYIKMFLLAIKRCLAYSIYPNTLSGNSDFLGVLNA